MALTVLIPAKRRKYLKTRHNQALVVWNPLPPALLSGIYVPDRLHLQHLFLYQQPAGFLTCISTHTITFPVLQKNQWHNTNLMLLTYSDEIAQAFHLLPFYPFSALMQIPAPAVLIRYAPIIPSCYRKGNH
jgi:hypothetical protein